MRRVLVLLLLGGCAHSRAEPQCNQGARPVGDRERLERARGELPVAEEARHGEKGAHEPIALPHSVIDSSTGNALDDAQLAARLRAARVVYVGEEHPNPHDHAAQLEVLAAAFAAEPGTALGLEMLPRTMQGALDRYVAGTLDEAGFLAEVDWEHTWGYDFGFYRPLLAFCRDHHLRAFALNAPRALAHAVAERGLAGLGADEKRDLPELKPGPEAHREFVREAFGAHPHGRFSDGKFENFYAAQLVWDETMADRVAAALSSAFAPRCLVVVAGEGHVRRFAVPERAARRGASPFVTILPVFDEDADDARRANVADLLWVLKTR
jgi:uncharacterized iron-regulated protein